MGAAGLEKNYVGHHQIKDVAAATRVKGFTRRLIRQNGIEGLYFDRTALCGESEASGKGGDQWGAAHVIRVERAMLLARATLSGAARISRKGTKQASN